MAQKNPRRSSILKSRNSIGPGDETKPLTIELYSDENNANITSNIGLPKRRVSFSAKTQIREIPNVVEAAAEKTILDYADMDMSVCESKLSEPEKTIAESTDMDISIYQPQEHEAEKTILDSIDMDMSVCESKLFEPEKTIAESTEMSIYHPQEHEAEKTNLDSINMDMSVCQSKPPEPEKTIAESTDMSIYQQQEHEAEKTNFDSINMDMSVCQPKLSEPEKTTAESTDMSIYQPQEDEAEKTNFDSINMDMSVCQPKLSEPEKTIAESTDMSIYQPQEDEAEKTNFDSINMDMSVCQPKLSEPEKTIAESTDMSIYQPQEHEAEKTNFDSIDMVMSVCQSKLSEPEKTIEESTDMDMPIYQTQEHEAEKTKFDSIDMELSALNHTGRTTSLTSPDLTQPQTTQTRHFSQIQIQPKVAISYGPRQDVINPAFLRHPSPNFLLRNPLTFGTQRPRQEKISERFGQFGSAKTPRHQRVGFGFVPAKPALRATEVQTSPNLMAHLVKKSVTTATATAQTSPIVVPTKNCVSANTSTASTDFENVSMGLIMMGLDRTYVVPLSLDREELEREPDPEPIEVEKPAPTVSANASTANTDIGNVSMGLITMGLDRTYVVPLSLDQEELEREPEPIEAEKPAPTVSTKTLTASTDIENVSMGLITMGLDRTYVVPVSLNQEELEREADPEPIEVSVYTSMASTDIENVSMGLITMGLDPTSVVPLSLNQEELEPEPESIEVEKPAPTVSTKTLTASTDIENVSIGLIKMGLDRTSVVPLSLDQEELEPEPDREPIEVEKPAPTVSANTSTRSTDIENVCEGLITMGLDRTTVVPLSFDQEESEPEPGPEPIEVEKPTPTVSVNTLMASTDIENVSMGLIATGLDRTYMVPLSLDQEELEPEPEPEPMEVEKPAPTVTSSRRQTYTLNSSIITQMGNSASESLEGRSCEGTSTDTDAKGIFETSYNFHLVSETDSESENEEKKEWADQSNLGPCASYYLQNYQRLNGIPKIDALDALLKEVIPLRRDDFEKVFKHLQRFENVAFTSDFLRVVRRSFDVEQFTQLPLQEQWDANKEFARKMDSQFPPKKFGPPSEAILKKIAMFRP